MTIKNRSVVLIFLSVFISLILSIFAVGHITAWLSQIPPFSKYAFVNPQAPIVVTKREFIRADDGSDTIEAINNIKTKLAAIVKTSSLNIEQTGNALVVTADGTFVTTKSAISEKGANYSVVLNDGQTFKISEIILDPATDLAFFKVDASSLPVASLARSNDVVVGQRLISVFGSKNGKYVEAAPIFSVKSQQDIRSGSFEASFPERSIGLSESPKLIGAVVTTTSGEVVGIWSGKALISSDVIKPVLSLLGSQEIKRPSFGFAYEVVGNSRAKLTASTVGVRILAVAKDSSAEQAGLKAGDLITAIGDKVFAAEESFEERLQGYKEGDIISLSITRGSQNLILNLIPTKLQ